MLHLRVLGIFTFTLLAGLAMTELILRVWLVSPRFKVLDPELGLLLNRAHAQVVWSEEGWSTASTNSFGLISPEVRNPRPPLRVLLLGNSFTEALNVSRDQSFSGLSEALLEGSEVINAAHSGWSMAEELGLLQRLTPFLKPDVVVAQFSTKSPFENSSVHVRLADDGRWVLAPASKTQSIERLIKNNTDWLAQESALFTMVVRRTASLVRRQAERISEKITANRDDQEIHKENREFYQPEEPDATLWILEKMAIGVDDLLVLVIPAIKYGASECIELPRAHARRMMIHGVAESAGTTVVDPTDEFCESYESTGQPLHGFHNSLMGTGHLNSQGHAIVARQLAKAIEVLRE